MHNSRIVYPFFVDLAASEGKKRLRIELNGKGVLESLKFWATDNNVRLYQAKKDRGLKLLAEPKISSNLTTTPVQAVYSGGKLLVLPYNIPYEDTFIQFRLTNETAAAKEAIILVTVYERG